eukprot:GHVS01060671.1.p1 GENE.GHVS01060671.1~~GHVS01060671.1.p1  ORF type:complete len:648 (+),score=87.30 GHVS01060671.1:720-2663(+)
MADETCVVRLMLDAKRGIGEMGQANGKLWFLSNTPETIPTASSFDIPADRGKNVLLLLAKQVAAEKVTAEKVAAENGGVENGDAENGDADGSKKKAARVGCEALIEWTNSQRERLFSKLIRKEPHFNAFLNLLLPYGYVTLKHLADNLRQIEDKCRKWTNGKHDKANQDMVVVGFELMANINAVNTFDVAVLQLLSTANLNADNAVKSVAMDGFFRCYVNDKVQKGLIKTDFAQKLANDVLYQPDFTSQLVAASVGVTRNVNDVSTQIQLLTKASECAKDCWDRMADALKKLASAANNGEASSIATSVDKLHQVAECLWKQSDLTRNWVNSQLADIEPVTTDGEEDAKHCVVKETENLYIKGCQLSDEDRKKTVACASQLTKALKQLPLITAEYLGKPNGEEVEWKGSDVCSGGIYDRASTLLVEEIRQQVKTAAENMKTIPVFHEYEETMANGLKQAAGDKESKTKLACVKSMDAALAKSEEVSHKVQLIRWKYLLVKRTKNRKETIVATLDRILKNEAENPVVKHLQSLLTARMKVQTKLTDILGNTPCYKEMAKQTKFNLYNMVEVVFDKYSWDVIKTNERWVEETGLVEFERELKREILKHFCNKGELEAEQKGELTELLGVPMIETQDDRVNALWEKLKRNP